MTPYEKIGQAFSLAARGIVLLYISHRLQELHQIADVVSVLRNGEVAGTIGIREASAETLAGLMFGQTIRTERPADLPAQVPAALEVRNLTRSDAFSNVSFTLHQGEILGIAGLMLLAAVAVGWHIFRVRRDGGVAVPPPNQRIDHQRISRFDLLRRMYVFLQSMAVLAWFDQPATFFDVPRSRGWVLTNRPPPRL